MNTKHIFISAIDLSEELPFIVKKIKNLQESFKEQDRAKKELERFIKLLENKFGEEISYIGMDVIGEKSYERFMFKGSGFLEAMIEAPAAFNAHFPDKKRAIRFCSALKEAFTEFLPDGPAKDIFIKSIKVQDENDSSLSVEKWDIIKKIR